MLIQSFQSVIAAFDVDVGLSGGEEIGGANIGKDADCVHGFEGGENGGAVGFVVEGAAFAFEATDGGIGINADEEEITEITGLLEVGDVTEMKEIEATVGDDENLLTAELLSPSGEVRVRNNFSTKIQLAVF